MLNHDDVKLDFVLCIYRDWVWDIIAKGHMFNFSPYSLPSRPKSPVRTETMETEETSDDAKTTPPPLARLAIVFSGLLVSPHFYAKI